LSSPFFPPISEEEFQTFFFEGPAEDVGPAVPGGPVPTSYPFPWNCFSWFFFVVILDHSMLNVLLAKYSKPSIHPPFPLFFGLWARRSGCIREFVFPFCLGTVSCPGGRGARPVGHRLAPFGRPSFPGFPARLPGSAFSWFISSSFPLLIFFFCCLTVFSPCGCTLFTRGAVQG